MSSPINLAGLQSSELNSKKSRVIESNLAALNYSKSNPGEPRIIEAAPTFEDATHMSLLVLENGTEEGKRTAREELLRYARELDRLAAQSGSAFDPQDTPMEGE